MILTAQEIELRLGHDIKIEPYIQEQLNANSYNLRLGRQLLMYSTPVLDCKANNNYYVFDIPDDGYVLYPHNLYLGQTLEYTETHNLVPQIEGRSSTARLGISIHLSAGFGDIGFKGHWTLEINVLIPVKVYCGMQIGQIFYHEIQGAPIKKYNSKYQNNKGVQPSMMYKDFLNAAH